MYVVSLHTESTDSVIMGSLWLMWLDLDYFVASEMLYTHDTVGIASYATSPMLEVFSLGFVLGPINALGIVMTSSLKRVVSECQLPLELP